MLAFETYDFLFLFFVVAYYFKLAFYSSCCRSIEYQGRNANHPKYRHKNRKKFHRPILDFHIMIRREQSAKKILHRASFWKPVFNVMFHIAESSAFENVRKLVVRKFSILGKELFVHCKNILRKLFHFTFAEHFVDILFIERLFSKRLIYQINIGKWSKPRACRRKMGIKMSKLIYPKVLICQPVTISALAYRAP